MNIINQLKIPNIFMYLRRYGKAIAKRPWAFVPVCVVVCGLLGIGVLEYHEEANPYKLWIPQNSDFVQNTDWLWDNYPPDSR